ncbi:MAG: D-tyrosyl-tRNA(Tyr) deacylase [Gammaproteobacteria bacterium]|nr:D-tyrosyl-tRNA(Tyr) deacylase [Gammaproteobacteria bacterium]
MRAVIQRVREAEVTVNGAPVGAIGVGLLVLVCISHGDEPQDAEALADKIVGLRIFCDEDDKMNRSVADVGGSVLLVSQFTLCANVRKGRRPSFTDAAPADVAASLIGTVANSVAARGVRVASGVFGERMLVSLVNQGPVTFVVDVSGGKVL